MSGRCIFCGGTGLSKQHVWPRWLATVLDCGAPEHTQVITRLDNVVPGRVTIHPELRREQGDFFSRKIRKVCRRCNSGWMSRLETQARPHLTAMILNHSHTLSANAQGSIAAWVAMTTVMAEFTDLPTVAIPADERRYLCAHRAPPTDGWRMWLGTYAGEQRTRRYHHYAASAVDRRKLIVLPLVPNYQYSTFVLGSLFIHVGSSNTPDLLVDFTGRTGTLLVQLWPPREERVRWPCPSALSDQDVDFVMNVALMQALRQDGRSHAADA